MNIPVYPGFTPITLGHKEIFDSAFKKLPPVISEFTFTNIYCWRKAYDFKAALLDGFIILRSDGAQRPHFFLPIGEGDLRQVIRRVLSDNGGEFIRIPEQAAAQIGSDKSFKITGDKANADYLYKTSDLIALKGAKFDGKRNLIRKFKNSHSYSYEELNSLNITQLLEFERVWCSAKDCEHTLGLAKERVAIHEMVSCFNRFALKGGVIRIDGAIRAAAIGEALNPEAFVVHVLKADPDIAGLYQTINNDFLRACAAGFNYVNLEQDLGIAGLRISKESYHPAGMIKKYTISLIAPSLTLPTNGEGID